MKHYSSCCASLLLAIAPALAQGANSQRCSEETIQRTRSALQINESAQIRASACARWGEKLLVAVALEAPGSTSQNPLDLPLHLAAFNAGTLDLVATYVVSLPDGGGEVVSEDSLWFDVRHFKLARDMSGFGLKVTQRSTIKCGDGGIGR